jgi:circadian clock protein KaiB
MSEQSASKRAPRYKFAVYIATSTRESQLALARLRTICDEQIPMDYEIEVFDLRKNPRLASDHNIIATPAIFRTLPAPVITKKPSEGTKNMIGTGKNFGAARLFQLHP